MHPYPHTYVVSASGADSGAVELQSQGLPGLSTAAPPEFDGPGGVWSPETLLCASVANCLVLTFRAIARASRFEWSAIECRTEAVLDKVDGVSRFTRYTSHVKLRVPAGADPARAHQLLEKAERGCLVANSLLGERVLVVSLETKGQA